MRIGRRLAWFLLAVAAWNVVTYATFVRNLAATEGRATGFYVAHVGLIVVNLAIAAVLGVVGVRALRRSRESDHSDREAPSSEPPNPHPGRTRPGPDS